MNPEKRTVLPRVAFTSYASRFNKPDVSEGFKDLTEIEFQVRGTLPFPVLPVVGKTPRGIPDMHIHIPSYPPRGPRVVALDVGWCVDGNRFSGWPWCLTKLSSGADMEGREVGRERRRTLGMVEVLGLGFTRSPTGEFIYAQRNSDLYIAYK